MLITFSWARHCALRVKALPSAIGFVCLVGLNAGALGQEAHKAHVHGIANLNLAYENGALELQFELPAMSLLGFEHKPTTAGEVETIQSTKEILVSSSKVVSVEGANCEADHVDVDISGPAGHALTNLEKQESDHSHSDNQHTEYETSHSELLASYQFNCANDQKVTSIAIGLFDHFPSLEEINVNWVTETQQGQSVLRPKSSTIELN